LQTETIARERSFVNDRRGVYKRETMKIESYTLAERPDLIDEQDRLMTREWPAFVIEGDGGQGWNELFSEFREFQFVLLEEGEIVAIGNTIPLALDRAVSDLPAEGWDWALRKGHEDREAGVAADTICALSATVVAGHRGKGLAARLLDEMKRIGRAEGLRQLIAPVRPTRKAEFPLIPMSRYATWTRQEGESFDPWLRIHLRAGGRIVRIASRSMSIGGSVTQWSRWTGMEFPGSGEYIIPGGLVPLSVDLQEGRGEYLEPNVWVVHEL
jgi:GNAT superfamily N-acetyltransferase